MNTELKTDNRPLPQVVEAPSRFRNTIGKYTIKRNSRCTSCGLCAELCPYGVHPRYEKYNKSMRPREHRCIGHKCQKNDYYCIDRCPEKALTLRANPLLETLGDYRWPAEMLLGHWSMAENGSLPEVDLEYSLGYSGGGFDKMRFKHFDPQHYLDISDTEIDTGLDLNKRNDERPRRRLSLPCYSGGMSFGSTALYALVGRARAAKRLNTLTCTGEGGYPDAFVPYADNVITQVATGLFGVREETIKYAYDTREVQVKEVAKSG